MSETHTIIRKGEVIIRKWNPELRIHEEKTRLDQILSDILQYSIEIEDTSFGQFFELIAKEPEFYEKAFKASMYGFPIMPYIEEYRKPAETMKDVDFIRVYWTADLDEDGLSCNSCLDGYGDWPEDQIGQKCKGGVAIEYTPIYKFKDLPFKLDESLQVWNLDDFSGTRAPILNTKMHFTAYDVVNAILFELTWAGDVSKGRECPFDKEPDPVV